MEFKIGQVYKYQDMHGVSPKYRGCTVRITKIICRMMSGNVHLSYQFLSGPLKGDRQSAFWDPDSNRRYLIGGTVPKYFEEFRI